MNGHQVLTLLLTGSFDRISEYTARADGATWSRTVSPGTNPVGFTLWHCARTLDWGFQATVRGVEEVAKRPEWRDRMPADGWFGAGVTPAVAQRIASEVGAGIVAAYNEAVRAESLAWLATQSDASLDAVPDLRARTEQAGYLHPEVWEEIASLQGIPSWQFLLRPCMNHVRVHLGEMDLLLQLAGQPPE